MEAIRLTVYEAADLVPDTYMGEYYSPSIPVYKKAEADAEFARLEHQIEVLNADLTRCQESKTAIGDKCLRLEADVERLTGVIKKIDDICSDPKKVMMLGIQAFGIVKQLTRQALSGGR